MKNSSNDESYEDFSYDVESLSTSPPVQETIYYILHRVYVCKEIQLLCEKSILKKLVLKLTKECVYSFSNRLIKQIDGYPMWGPLYVVFSQIYVSKLEEEIILPMKREKERKTSQIIILRI